MQVGLTYNCLNSLVDGTQPIQPPSPSVSPSPSPSQTSPRSSHQLRKTKRPRASQACEACRRYHRKCPGSQPDSNDCARCIRAGRLCVWERPPPPPRDNPLLPCDQIFEPLSTPSSSSSSVGPMTPPIPYAYSTIVGQLKPGSEASTGTSFDQDCKRTADEHNLLLFAFSLDEHDLSDTTLPRFRCFHPSICDPGPFADNGHILLGSVLEALALDVTHNDPTSDELKAMPRFPPPPHVSASRTCPQPTVRSPTAVGEAVEQLDEANGVLSLLTQDPMLFMPHNNPASTACSELRPPNSDLEWSEYLQSDMWSALDPQLPDAAHLQVEAAPNPFC